MKAFYFSHKQVCSKFSKIEYLLHIMLNLLEDEAMQRSLYISPGKFLPNTSYAHLCTSIFIQLLIAYHFDLSTFDAVCICLYIEHLLTDSHTTQNSLRRDKITPIDPHSCVAGGKPNSCPNYRFSIHYWGGS